MCVTDGRNDFFPRPPQWPEGHPDRQPGLCVSYGSFGRLRDHLATARPQSQLTVIDRILGFERGKRLGLSPHPGRKLGSLSKECSFGEGPGSQDGVQTTRLSSASSRLHCLRTSGSGGASGAWTRRGCCISRQHCLGTARQGVWPAQSLRFPSPQLRTLLQSTILASQNGHRGDTCGHVIRGFLSSHPPLWLRVSFGSSLTWGGGNSQPAERRNLVRLETFHISKTRED